MLLELEDGGHVDHVVVLVADALVGLLCREQLQRPGQELELLLDAFVDQPRDGQVRHRVAVHAVQQFLGQRKAPGFGSGRPRRRSRRG